MKFHLDQPTRICPIVCLQDHSWRVILALHSLLQLHWAAVNDVHVFLGDLLVDVDVSRWVFMQMVGVEHGGKH